MRTETTTRSTRPGSRRQRRTRRLTMSALATVLALAGAGLAALPAAAAPSGYVPKSALINEDSITPGVITVGATTMSVEQYAAQRAGFTVTVATGATVERDDRCGLRQVPGADHRRPDVRHRFPPRSTDNAAVWSPVVMGKTALNSLVGNRSLVGTDPVFHYQNGGGGAQPTDPADPSTAGAEHLVQSGITYAGGVGRRDRRLLRHQLRRQRLGPGGARLAQRGRNRLHLRQLSAVRRRRGDDRLEPGLHLGVLHRHPGWGCSVHTTYPTYPGDWQPLAVATDTVSKPTCGTDTKDGTTACGEAYILVAGQGIVVTAPDLSLAPASNSSAAGGSHTLTATVTQAGSPSAGQSDRLHRHRSERRGGRAPAFPLRATPTPAAR